MTSEQGAQGAGYTYQSTPGWTYHDVTHYAGKTARYSRYPLLGIWVPPLSNRSAEAVGVYLVDEAEGTLGYTDEERGYVSQVLGMRRPGDEPDQTEIAEAIRTANDNMLSLYPPDGVPDDIREARAARCSP
jgi:hypothetical protein